MLERLEHLVGAHGEDASAAAAGDVAERVGEEGLADPDGADDGDVGVGVEEAQRDELVEQRPVEGDLGGRVPGFELHGGIEVGASGRAAVTAWLSRREASSLRTSSRKSWWGIFCWRASARRSGRVSSMRRELEPAQDGLQVGRDRHRGSLRRLLPRMAVGERSGRAYWLAGRR